MVPARAAVTVFAAWQQSDLARPQTDLGLPSGAKWVSATPGSQIGGFPESPPPQVSERCK